MKGTLLIMLLAMGIFIISGCTDQGDEETTEKSISLSSLANHQVSLEGSTVPKQSFTFCINNTFLALNNTGMGYGTWDIVNGELVLSPKYGDSFIFIVNNNEFKKDDTCTVNFINGTSTLTIMEVKSVPNANCSVDTTAPIFTSATSIYVNENQLSAITLIATDDRSTVSYSISGTDSESFTVNSTTGEVIFKSAPDYETKTSYTFTAKAIDKSGNSTTKTIDVYIQDINEVQPDTTAPIFSSPNSVSVNENQTSAITLMATDDRSTVSYSISGTDSGSFTVNSSTGEVNFINPPDYEVKTSYTFTATATDVAGNSENKTIYISIIDVDEAIPDTIAPTFTSASSVSVNENQTSAITLQATDNRSSVNYSISGTDSGSFMLNTTTGLVTFTNAPDYEIKTSYTFIAKATDNAGNYINQAVTIHIINLSEGVDTALVGTWKHTATGYIETITYNSNSTGSSYSVYDANDIRMVGHSTFDYKVDGTKIIQPNNVVTNKINTSNLIRSITYATSAAFMINYLNQQAYCGYTNWQVNVAKEIGNRSCIPPSKLKGIYVIKNEKLYSGTANSDGSYGNDGYPDIINYDQEFQKQ